MRCETPRVAMQALVRCESRTHASPPRLSARRFLHRFHVCLREDGCVRATWIESVLGQMVDKLVGLSVQDSVACGAPGRMRAHLQALVHVLGPDLDLGQIAI